MQHSILVALASGLGGMIGWGFADFFAKRTIDKLGDIPTLFWGQLVGIAPLSVLFAVHPGVHEVTPQTLSYLLLLGAWSGLSYIPTYVAFGKGGVSLLSPIFASYAAVFVVLSSVYLHEDIPLIRLACLLIIFVGIVFVNGGPSDVVTLLSGRAGAGVAGLPEILLAIGLYSVWLIALDRFLNGRYWVPYLLAIRIASTASLFAYARVAGRSLAVRDRSLWGWLAAIGLFDVAAFSFVSFGFSATPFVSVVAMLSGAFSLPTILLARVFLKEKSSAIQTFGSAVVVAGIMLLTAA